MLRTLAVGLVVLCACGDNIVPDVTPDAPPPRCGDNKIDPGEDCDDGFALPDVTCDATCHFTCGNGVLDDTFGELCDPGIASGPGACPTACDDGDACTSDLLTGTACQAACITAPITTPADGDGCCPSGANALTDSDCAPMCGNGVVEAGETCDTAIASGNGACITACDDGMTCTRDTVKNAGTCTAACQETPITMAMNNDGCCPTGATSGTDNDCAPACGNGVVDVAAGETCDTAITSGVGKCPTTCSDGIACTKDTLSMGGSCKAVCSFPAITLPINGDTCCPPGANANTDNDCAPKCGNSVVEAGEECDDGNMNNTDACSNACKLTAAVPTAFRMSDLDLRDPHVFVNFLGCRDVTDTQLVGFSVNNSLQTSIQTDATMPPDGKLDLSIAAVFRPLKQTAGTTPVEAHFPSCTAPMATTTCSRNPASSPTINATATTQTAGTCLGALAGTTHPYAPAITTPTATPAGACFAAPLGTFTINLGGIPITLRDTTFAATYVGNPAGSVANGLLRGFISETDADATIIPNSFPLVGGQPLSSLLPGGTNACPSYSDKDTDAGVVGWWFYLNFPAPKVTWVDN